METENLKRESRIIPETSPTTPENTSLENTSLENTSLRNMPDLWRQNDILIFLVDLDDYDTLGTEYLEDAEKEDLIKLKTGYFRKRYVSSRTVLKFILCHILEEKSVSDIATYKDKHGKIHIRNHDELHVCISYTENIASLAISKVELGVDIEVRKKRSLSNISRYLDKKTFQAVKSGNDLDILAMWTLKEAYCKFSNRSIFSTFNREPDLTNVAHSSYIIDCKYILSLITRESWHAINISRLQKIEFL